MNPGQLLELAFLAGDPRPTCPQWKKSPSKRLYHELEEVLTQLNHQREVNDEPGVELNPQQPHPYDIRYLQGRLARLFMHSGTPTDRPIVWATRGSRQTRHIGTYLAVFITVFVPPPLEEILALGPVPPMSRGEKIANSTVYIHYQDLFFSCFLSLGASTLTRNPGEVLIIRMFLKFYIDTIKKQSGETTNCNPSRKKILDIELKEGVCLRDFFNTETRGTEHLRNVSIKYKIHLLHAGKKTIEILMESVAPSQGGSIQKQRVMKAALRGVDHTKWDAMVTGFEGVLVSQIPTMYPLVATQCGTYEERTAMNSFICHHNFKDAVVATVTRKSKVVAEGDPFGTLDSGVVTEAFLDKLKHLRLGWVKNRKIWFSTERNEEEANQAFAEVKVLIENYSNKKDSAQTYLHQCKKY
jgi:hypothetical protein